MVKTLLVKIFEQKRKYRKMNKTIYNILNSTFFNENLIFADITYSKPSSGYNWFLWL